MTVLSEETWADVFSFLGGEEVARNCSFVSPNWSAVIGRNQALWEHLVGQDYGLRQNGQSSIDWKVVYQYIYTRSRKRSLIKRIAAQVIFADDGVDPLKVDRKHPPQNAFDPNYFHRSWLTNAHVDHDVDAVADLGIPHLVVGFKVANGYSIAPVTETLAFASLDLPDLDATSWYNGFAGKDYISQAFNYITEPSKANSSFPVATQPTACFLRAYGDVMKESFRKHSVARYAHFKLLTSNTEITRSAGEPRNMEVVSLQVLGIPLPHLSDLLRRPELMESPPTEFEQRMRQHPILDECDWSPFLDGSKCPLDRRYAREPVEVCAEWLRSPMDMGLPAHYDTDISQPPESFVKFPYFYELPSLKIRDDVLQEDASAESKTIQTTPTA